MSRIDLRNRPWTIAGAGLLVVVALIAVVAWRQWDRAARLAAERAAQAAAAGQHRAAAPITRSVEVRDAPVAGRRPG
jgi:hypothetical protein